MKEQEKDLKPGGVGDECIFPSKYIRLDRYFMWGGRSGDLLSDPG